MSKRPTWRERLAPIIREALRETEGEPEPVIRRALRRAWNDAGLGERRYFPYEVWCSEVRRQRGLEKPKPKPKRNGREESDERQPTLF